MIDISSYLDNASDMFDKEIEEMLVSAGIKVDRNNVISTKKYMADHNYELVMFDFRNGFDYIVELRHSGVPLSYIELYSSVSGNTLSVDIKRHTYIK